MVLLRCTIGDTLAEGDSFGFHQRHIGRVVRSSCSARGRRVASAGDRDRGSRLQLRSDRVGGLTCPDLTSRPEDSSPVRGVAHSRGGGRGVRAVRGMSRCQAATFRPRPVLTFARR